MKTIEEILKSQKTYFNTGITKDLNFRIEGLKKLKQVILDHEEQLLQALKIDLNKSSFEAYATEIGIVLTDLNNMLKHIKKWSKPRRVKTPLMHFLSSSYIYQEPYGQVLIMSPWNYPFQLSLAPLIGALGAGNTVVLKPSEYSAQTSLVIEKIITEAFPPEYVSVVRGGRDANTSLLEQRFDYIFFTGSTHVGHAVMEAASKNLTPLTLELGGKSPCLIDKSANLELAAKRIIWGKLINSGQTCVAPDYLLVHEDLKEALIPLLKKYITQFYGSDPLSNEEYPKMISLKHFNRVTELIKTEKILLGGEFNPTTLKITPTVLDETNPQSPIMQEEIFGPVLPLITFKNLEEAFALIESKPKPLAFYLFINNKDKEKEILERISFGGGCVNDTIMHVANHYLPFGGVGASGLGSYHGKNTFTTFSHSKSILKKSNIIDVPLRYPPFKNALKLLKRVMK